MLTAEQYAAVATAGIGIPMILSVCGVLKNNVAACASAALGLYYLARGAEALTSPDYTAVSYADSCARMLALTALAETAGVARNFITHGISGNSEVRLYECIALLMIGALLLAQFVEILQIIIPGGIEGGTFIGIVIAGLTFSMRDLASCIISGLFESIKPRFAVGDSISIGAIDAIIVEKGMITVRGEWQGDTVHIPTSNLTRDALRIKCKHGTQKSSRVTLAPASA